MTTPRFAPRIRVCIALASFAWPLTASGQVYSGTGNIHEVFVGTETESYLRALDLTDTTSDASWTIRPLSPVQLKRLARSLGADPWQARLTGFAGSESPFHVGFLSPNASVRYNSQFPYGSNDAAIWAGRGATIGAQAGIYADLGPVSVSLMPIVFRAENTAFPLAFSALPCACGEPTYGGVVDLPQRFGTQPYQRLDPGQSTVRVDAVGLAAGFTTANEGWGPVAEYPFLLGNNAPGFPHVFFGTSQPLPIFIGKAQLKVIYGRLDQSSYSPVTGSKFYASRVETGRVRFASGLIATFQPRGFDGLEIGGSRFIHSVWPRSGIPSNYLRKPLQAFLKKNLPGIDQQIAGDDNQLASFFARWAFRESGLEVYGEYGREDNSYDLRDFVQEPDHQRAYSLGLGKTFSKQSSQFNVLRIELINFQLPSLATTGRGEGSIYVHSPTRQGHTNRGQLLGADVGVGAAAGSTIRWDHYSSGGRWAVFWRRDVRQETSDPTLKFPSVPQISDVLHAFGFERLRFTHRFDVTTSLTLMRDFSRDYANSRFNANAAVAITLPH
ncbi:MAG: capsule assembly Wzi family protein [Gemmatimonadaceae bacterium]